MIACSSNFGLLFVAMEDYDPADRTISIATRFCFPVRTIDNSVPEPNKNFTLNLMPFFILRDIITDIPSAIIEIIDNDGKVSLQWNISFFFLNYRFVFIL